MRANVGWLRGLRPGRADAMLRCILPVFFWRVLGWSVGLAGAFTSMRRLKRAKTGAHTANFCGQTQRRILLSRCVCFGGGLGSKRISLWRLCCDGGVLISKRIAEDKVFALASAAFFMLIRFCVALLAARRTPLPLLAVTAFPYRRDRETGKGAYTEKGEAFCGVSPRLFIA